MKREIIADAAVRRPDRRQAGRFRCHHVDPIPEIDREQRNSQDISFNVDLERDVGEYILKNIYGKFMENGSGKITD